MMKKVLSGLLISTTLGCAPVTQQEFKEVMNEDVVIPQQSLECQTNQCFIDAAIDCTKSSGTLTNSHEFDEGLYNGITVTTKHSIAFEPNNDKCILTYELTGIFAQVTQTWKYNMDTEEISQYSTEMSQRVKAHHQGVLGQELVCTYSDANNLIRDLIPDPQSEHYFTDVNVECDSSGNCLHYTKSNTECVFKSVPESRIEKEKGLEHLFVDVYEQ